MVTPSCARIPTPSRSQVIKSSLTSDTIFSGSSNVWFVCVWAWPPPCVGRKKRCTHHVLSNHSSKCLDSSLSKFIGRGFTNTRAIFNVVSSFRSASRWCWIGVRDRWSFKTYLLVSFQNLTICSLLHFDFEASNLHLLMFVEWFFSSVGSLDMCENIFWKKSSFFNGRTYTSNTNNLRTN